VEKSAKLAIFGRNDFRRTSWQEQIVKMAGTDPENLTPELSSDPFCSQKALRNKKLEDFQV